MIRKIKADVVHTIAGAALQGGIVVLENKSGEILEVWAGEENPYADFELERYAGAIVPNFVNAHCHLELSHMLAAVPTGTGLLPFIKGVVQGRNTKTREEILAAIESADAGMWAAGIAAVGDICNVVDTFATKRRSHIAYYSFVECFDFWQTSNARAEFDKYNSVFAELAPAAHQRKVLVPHAPYSVSPALFALINAENARHKEQSEKGSKQTISIHNQETEAENRLFLDKKSDFVPFFGAFGFDYADLRAEGRTAIHYALEQLPRSERWLFVHNTLTTVADIEAAQAANADTYWATCPNANLYIENRLPRYENFLQTGAKVCIGTDSLTSNWQLCILEELKTILRYQSAVPQAELLRWATLNGAAALGMEAQLGSIEKGKRCGLNLLENLNEAGGITQKSSVRRLI